MKKIEAIIRPERVIHVRNALEKAGYPGMTITEVEGHGHQKGKVQQWRGEKFKVDFIPKVKLEIITLDQDAERLIKTIIESAATGNVGDGKIFVSEVSEVIRIRTRERGEKAVMRPSDS
ncbi:MAG: P-II family nitrogen regulator [Candidatus Omnitrophota bacterium]